MSHTSRLRRMPDTFRQLTGITPEALDQLLAELEPRYQQADTKRKTWRPRQRKPGAGRKFALPLADRILMLLMYYRTYTTHALLGFLFGVDQSAACRNINPLQPLLAGICRIPERRVELEPDEIREPFFDATERAIPRPPGAEAVLLGEEEAARPQAPSRGRAQAQATRPRRSKAAGADRRRVEGVPRQDA